MVTKRHFDLNTVVYSDKDKNAGRYPEEVLKDYIADSMLTGADSFFVESGAGSGKTTILARRIVSQMGNGARPEDFAILTYTKEAADELRYKIRKYRPTNRMHLSTIYGFFRRILAHFDVKGRPYGLSNKEVAERLMDILRGDPGVLEKLRKQYRFIYVDEFQDADLMTAKLIRLLACDEEGRLRDGALFIVGDPRQAIYSRSGSGAEAFNETKEWMQERKEAGDNVNIMSFCLNFRTDQEVLDWINERFRKIIPSYKDMISGRRSTFPVKGSFYILEKGSRMPKGKAKAMLSAERIKKLMEDEPKLDFNNFMVVTWNDHESQLYKEALAEAGIPCEDCGRMDADKNNVVRVMTVYEAKGLAGDIVFIENKAIMKKRSPYKALVLEYVAVTRARHAVIFMEPEPEEM